MSTLISLKDIGKNFGDVEALSNVNLEISRGEVVGLVGGNGAGKTTLLRIISGVYNPSEGSIEFEDGVDGNALFICFPVSSYIFMVIVENLSPT